MNLYNRVIYLFIYCRPDDDNLEYWDVLTMTYKQRYEFLRSKNLRILEDNEVRTVGAFLDWRYGAIREENMAARQ